MALLTLELLGPFQASIGAKALDDFRTNKGQALLIYLATERAPCSRESLMELFWPGLPGGSARVNLRQILYQIRKAIPEVSSQEDGGGEMVPLLVANRREIHLNPAAAVEVDVVQFETLLARVHSHQHEDKVHCLQCRANLARAVEIYRGDFLVDFYLDDSDDFETWAESRRDAGRRSVLDALEMLTGMYVQQRDFDQARIYAERQLSIDNLREAANRQLMEIMVLNGRRSEAMAVYEDFRRLLAEELGMEPSRRTTELFQRIQTGDLVDEPSLERRIRGFELKKELGRGAFGAIHLAHQPSVGREVAVKIIRLDFANDPEFIRRFENEAQMVAQLEHPFIVPLYDYWRDPDGAYLVMRYLRGGNLLSALESGPWKPETAAGMLDQVAGALSAAHQQGVVHRDIKPANVLLDEDGNCFLSDFGIAKNLSDEAGLTATGAIVGTLDYISPEQIRDEDLSGRADIYSLGALLYETLTGEKPFPDSSAANLVHKHLKEPVPLVGASRPDLPPQIDEVIQRATAKRPADRYADALEMAEAFHLAIGASAAMPGDVILPAVADIYNPYKGLRAFQEWDADDFFGRDALVDSLLARLGAKRDGAAGRFLALVGPSGSGKSSAVKAGLLPALRLGALPNSEKWFVAETVPGSHPLKELEQALWSVAIDPPPSLVEPMERDTRGMLRTIRRVLPNEGGAELLLVVDQFEELFTLVTDEERRNFFIDSLITAISAPNSPLRVIVTLRADFHDRPLQLQPLGQLLKENTEIVLPLNQAELTWAIREPARRMGVGLEPGLAETIVSEVAEQPGALPLLQFAMTELFERRQENLMTQAAYDDIGGVTGALVGRAEAQYKDLDGDGRESARQLFLRLVTLGEGVEDTRRRVLRSELEALGDEQLTANGEALAHNNELLTVNDSNRQLAIDHWQLTIDNFGSARLLTFDYDPATRAPTVEVAHEALLREWPRLHGWLDESRNDVRMQRLLAEAVAEWRDAGHDPGFLLRDARLDQFAGWAEGSSVALTAEEREFLANSIAARTERQRKEQHLLAEKRAAGRLRRLSVALAVFIILAIAAAIIAFNSSAEANRQRTAAEENEGRAVAQAAAAATAQSEARTAESAAVAAEAEAVAERDLAAAAEALAVTEAERAQIAEEAALDAQAATERQRRIILGQSLAAMGPTILEQSGDNALATLLALEAANINEEVGGELNWVVELGLRQALNAAFFSTVLGNHEQAVRSAAFSPDGGTLAAVGVDGMVRLWDLTADNTPPQVLIGSEVADEVRLNPEGISVNEVSSVTFAPDGQSFVTGGGDRLVHLWDAADPAASTAVFRGHSAIINALAFAPDGQILASGSDDRTIRLWNPADVAAPRMILEAQASPIRSLAFAPDGQILASGSSDGRIFLWDMTAPETTFAVLEGHQGSVLGLAFFPDGRTLASGGGDGSVRLWDVPTLAESTLLYQGEEVIWSVNIDQEGNSIATSGADGLIRIWELGNVSAPPTVLGGHSEPVYTLAFAPDGKALVSGSRDTTVRFWDLSGSVIQPVILEDNQGPVLSLSFATDGNTLASSDRTARGDGAIRLWSLAEPDAQPAVLQHPVETIQRVAFAPDGQRLASAGSAVVLWDLSEPTPAPQTLLSTDPPDPLLGFDRTEFETVAFAPDGRSLAATRDFVFSWDLTHPDQPYRRFDKGEGAIDDIDSGSDTRYGPLAYSPDSRHIVANTQHDQRDDFIYLWDLTENDAEATVLIDDDGGAVNFYIQDLTITPDGETLISGGDLRPVRLWDLTEPGAQPVDIQLGIDLLQEGTHVKSLDVSPDGQRLALAMGDGAIQVLSLVDLSAPPIVFRGHEGPARAVSFSPDGKALASGGDDATIRLWPTLEGMRETGCQQVRRNLTLEEWHLYLGQDETYRPTCPNLEGTPDASG